jgi:murein DD-endopeptidase MepM/ murein hydrolase activator NlpD
MKLAGMESLFIQSKMNFHFSEFALRKRFLNCLSHNWYTPWSSPHVKSQSITRTSTERDFYGFLSMNTDSSPGTDPHPDPHRAIPLCKHLPIQSDRWRDRLKIPPFSLLGSLMALPSLAIAAPVPAVEGCPIAALSRLQSHTITAGETIEAIAQRYGLVPETLMGLNPVLRNRQAPVGVTLQIPPFNGIRIEVPAGTPLRQVADRYKVRADVLFEVNGCQPNPRVLFVPGVIWSPLQTGQSSNSQGNAPRFAIASPLTGTPSILLGFGFKLRNPGDVAPHSGVDLAAAPGTLVTAVAEGTVAFAGNQGALGNLIVINHQQGYQTRYAHLDQIRIRVGQRVTRGTAIGTTGTSGKPSSIAPHLHFEVRSNSKLGWVAEDPVIYLRP